MRPCHPGQRVIKNGQNTSNVRISVLTISILIHTGAVLVREDGDSRKQLSAGHFQADCIQSFLQDLDAAFVYRAIGLHEDPLGEFRAVDLCSAVISPDSWKWDVPHCGLVHGKDHREDDEPASSSTM